MSSAHHPEFAQAVDGRFVTWRSSGGRSAQRAVLLDRTAGRVVAHRGPAFLAVLGHGPGSAPVLPCVACRDLAAAQIGARMGGGSVTCASSRPSVIFRPNRRRAARGQHVMISRREKAAPACPPPAADRDRALFDHELRPRDHAPSDPAMTSRRPSRHSAGADHSVQPAQTQRPSVMASAAGPSHSSITLLQ